MLRVREAVMVLALLADTVVRNGQALAHLHRRSDVGARWCWCVHLAAMLARRVPLRAARP